MPSARPPPPPPSKVTSAVRDGSFHESIEVIYHSRPPPPGCNSDLQFVEILPVFSVYALETGIKQHFTENLLIQKCWQDLF